MVAWVRAASIPPFVYIIGPVVPGFQVIGARGNIGDRIGAIGEVCLGPCNMLMVPTGIAGVEVDINCIACDGCGAIEVYDTIIRLNFFMRIKT